MKKTLAAVLAAAMALSTATVAFADDTWIEFSEEKGGISGTRELPATMGDTTKYRITSVTTEDGDVISGDELARAMDEGDITATVVVTSNQSKLDGRPSITAGTYKTSTTNQAVTKVTKYYWADGVNQKFTMKGAEFTAKAGKEITTIYVNTDAGSVMVFDAEGAGTDIVLKKGDTNYATIMADLAVAHQDWIETKEVAEKTKPTESGPLNGIQLKFKINHTYGTGSVTVGMKLRFTARRDTTVDGIDMKKGDTLTSEQVDFKAEYAELSNYYKDMQLTLQEVSDNKVILDASDLYDAIGNDTFTITFGDDIAMLKAKLATSQKDVNLYYVLDEISEIKDAYPDVDFTFLTFKGNPSPSFVNTGDMIFAAEDKNTTVYLWDGEVLEPVSDPKTYDDTYKTVTVKNVKKLGTYVIADQILEVEEDPEEPAEPVDSTPVAEPDDEGENPNTGAC